MKKVIFFIFFLIFFIHLYSLNRDYTYKPYIFISNFYSDYGSIESYSTIDFLGDSYIVKGNEIYDEMDIIKETLMNAFNNAWLIYAHRRGNIKDIKIRNALDNLGYDIRNGIKEISIEYIVEKKYQDKYRNWSFLPKLLGVRSFILAFIML